MNDGAVTVDVARREAARKVPVRGLKAKARRILRLLELEDCELSVALVGDEEIRRLNGRYRSLDEPTDVLSFPVDEPLPSGRRVIGDVIISVEKAARARHGNAAGHWTMNWKCLLIHGILHNLGYDHERSVEDEREMHALERRLRRELKAGADLVSCLVNSRHKMRQDFSSSARRDDEWGRPSDARGRVPREEEQRRRRRKRLAVSGPN